jgi:hypothetical protein
MRSIPQWGERQEAITAEFWTDSRQLYQTGVPAVGIKNHYWMLSIRVLEWCSLVQFFYPISIKVGPKDVHWGAWWEWEQSSPTAGFEQTASCYQTEVLQTAVGIKRVLVDTVYPRVLEMILVQFYPISIKVGPKILHWWEHSESEEKEQNS